MAKIAIFLLLRNVTSASALKEIFTQIRMLYQLVIKQKVAQKLTLLES